MSDRVGDSSVYCSRDHRFVDVPFNGSFVEEHLATVDELRDFCTKLRDDLLLWRDISDELYPIWDRRADAIWYGMRLNGRTNIPAQPAKSSDSKTILCSLDRVLDWCANLTSLDSPGRPISKRVSDLVEMFRNDAELNAQGKTTKSKERKSVYGRLRAAKQKQREIYAEAEKLYEAEKVRKCRLG